MQAARTGSTVLHYALSGPADGPAVVFVNSLGTDFRVWGPLLPFLPTGLRILRYDKRGHGLSDCPPGPYGIADHVADLAGLLEACGLRQVVVVGLSIGGMIAQGLAAARPDLVKGAVFCCTAHVIGTAAMWEQRIQALRSGGIEGLADAVMERWFSPAFRASRADELHLWRNMLTRTPLEGYIASCAALRDADLTEAARGIRVPVLCVAGSSDGSTPPDVVRGLADLVPGSRFRLLDGPGHIPCVEAPQALGREITAFLKENGLA